MVRAPKRAQVEGEVLISDIIENDNWDKVMAGTVYDLMKDTSLVKKAKESFKKDTGGKKYVSAFNK